MDGTAPMSSFDSPSPPSSADRLFSRWASSSLLFISVFFLAFEYTSTFFVIPLLWPAIGGAQHLFGFAFGIYHLTHAISAPVWKILLEKALSLRTCLVISFLFLSLGNLLLFFSSAAAVAIHDGRSNGLGHKGFFIDVASILHTSEWGRVMLVCGRGMCGVGGGAAALVEMSLGNSGERNERAASLTKHRLVSFVGATSASLYFLVVLCLVPFNQFLFPFHSDSFTLAALLSSFCFAALIPLFLFLFSEESVSPAIPLLSARSLQDVESDSVRSRIIRRMTSFLLIANSIFLGGVWLLYPNMAVLGAFYGKLIHSLPSVWMTYFPVFMGDTTCLLSLFLFLCYLRSQSEFEESKTLFLPSSFGIAVIGSICLFNYAPESVTARYALGATIIFAALSFNQAGFLSSVVKLLAQKDISPLFPLYASMGANFGQFGGCVMSSAILFLQYGKMDTCFEGEGGYTKCIGLITVTGLDALVAFMIVCFVVAFVFCILFLRLFWGLKERDGATEHNPLISDDL